MNNAILNCRENISRVKELGGLYEAVTSITTNIIDASDLLRAQVVMIVSAIDHYVHEITRIGMLEIYNGNRPATQAFQRFQISTNVLQSMISSSHNSSSIFEDEIRTRHSYLSFQHPDKIAEAIRLFYPDPLWPAVGQRLGTTATNIKTRLRLIVDTKNFISKASNHATA